MGKGNQNNQARRLLWAAALLLWGFASASHGATRKLHPVECPRMYGVVAGRASKQLEALTRRHALELGLPAEQRLLGFFKAILDDYLVRGHVSRELIDSAREQARQVFAESGAEAERAELIADEWLTNSLGAIDTRFPLVPNLYSVPDYVGPSYQLVREVLSRDDWKRLPKSAKANPADHFRKQAGGIRLLLSQVSANHPRIAILEKEAARSEEIANAFEAVAKWEDKLYHAVPSAESRGFPYGFQSKAEFETFTGRFARRFTEALSLRTKGAAAEEDQTVFIHGSSLTGLSYERKFDGLRRPFGPHSDFDFAIVVPDEVFADLRRQGYLSEEEPGRRSIPYSLDKADALRKMGVESVVREMSDDLPVKKISFSFYSQSYAAERQKQAPYLKLEPSSH